MTDQMPTRHQNLLSIMDKLRATPGGADHNGFTDLDRARTSATVAHAVESSPYAYLEPEPEPHIGMSPNPAQGHGGAPAPTQHQGSPLERIRAGIAAGADAIFDEGGAA